MTCSESERLAERTILRNLGRAHNGMTTSGTLWAETAIDLAGLSYSAWKAALVRLEEKGQVVVVDGEDRRRVKLTDAGRARLLEN